MKKFTAFLLAFALLLSLAMPLASATSITPDTSTDAASKTTATSSASSIISDMAVDAESAMLVDMDTDVLLYNQNGYERICPASLTKVMTALLVMEHIKAGDYKLTDTIKAQKDCWADLDSTSSNQNIKPGEKLTIEELLYCLMVASANESANILAEETSGSIEAFVAEMNTRAKQLGCTDTNFVNPHGMPHEEHYTTCHDLYLIAREAMTYSQFREIVKTDEYYVEKTNKSERRHFFNTNALLSNLKYRGYYYQDCIGIKTGTTDQGGYNLLAAAENDGKTLISVVIGCRVKHKKDGSLDYKQFSESSRLLKWGFENFSTITIVDSSVPYAQVKVELSTEADSVSVRPEHSITAELPNDITADSFTYSHTLQSSVEAPVQKGDVLGTLELTLNGQSYATISLVADADVQVSTFLKNKAIVERLLSLWYVKTALVAVIALLLVLILRFTVFRRNRRYGSRYSGSRHGGYRGSRRRRR